MWNITCVPWWIVPHILLKPSHLCVSANKICYSIWWHCSGKYRRFALCGGSVLLRSHFKNIKPCPLFNCLPSLYLSFKIRALSLLLQLPRLLNIIPLFWHQIVSCFLTFFFPRSCLLQTSITAIEKLTVLAVRLESAAAWGGKTW